MQTASLKSDFRLCVTNHYVSEGRAPTRLEVAAAFDLGWRRVLGVFQRLAWEWYHDRLEPSWRRKSLHEAQRLFAELGMASDFWQLWTHRRPLGFWVSAALAPHPSRTTT